MGIHKHTNCHRCFLQQVLITAMQDIILYYQ